MSSKNKKAALTVLGAVCVLAGMAASYIAGYYHGYNGRVTTLAPDAISADANGEGSSEDALADVEKLEEDLISVLCCGVDNTQKLTDVIMYAQFNTKQKTVDILRIPRDTFVGSKFPTSKINAVYGHPYDGMTGIETLKSYLEENWKLDIDYYATIDLAGVRDIVDDMGGITMNIEKEINYLPGKVLYPGEQTLDGEKAEWILRYRSGYANGDLGRIDAQTQFLTAAIDKVHEMGRLKCVPILMKHYGDIKTDMPLNKMISVASALFELETDDIEMHVVPGQGTMYYSYAVYEADEEALVEILNESFTLKEEDITTDTLNVATIHGSKKPSYQQQKPSYQQPTYQKPSYEQSGVQSQTSQSEEKDKDTHSGAPYQYDDQGRPLYRLDENGDPIYDYDKNGNIVYLYEQVEDEMKEDSKKPSKHQKDDEETESSKQDKKPSSSKQNKTEKESDEDKTNKVSKTDKTSTTNKTESSSSSKTNKTESSSKSKTDKTSKTQAEDEEQESGKRVVKKSSSKTTSSEE